MTRREILVLASTSPCWGQFTSSVRVVSVQVTVRNKRGQLMRDLTREDFDLTDEGRKQEIRYFSADNDQPLTTGVLFDISGSQRRLLAQQQGAALAFLNKMVKQDSDRAFLAGFDQRFRMISPLTNSAVLLAQGLSAMNMDDPGANGTALFDAVIRAAESVAAQPGRKAIVILSDGQDTASGARSNDAIEEALRANATLYPIRMFDREVFAIRVPGIAARNLEDGRVALDRLAKQTGGRLIDARQELGESLSQIEEELRSQYILGFTPSANRPGYRKLRVKVKRNGVTVQARDGYFATE